MASKRRERMRLADPVTYNSADAALKAARDLFGPALDAIMGEMKALLAGRRVNELAAAEAARFMSLRAEFDAKAIEQRNFAEADLHHRLSDDDGGGEPVDPAPRPLILT